MKISVRWFVGAVALAALTACSDVTEPRYPSGNDDGRPNSGSPSGTASVDVQAVVRLA